MLIRNRRFIEHYIECYKNYQQKFTDPKSQIINNNKLKGTQQNYFLVKWDTSQNAVKQNVVPQNVEKKCRGAKKC